MHPDNNDPFIDLFGEEEKPMNVRTQLEDKLIKLFEESDDFKRQNLFENLLFQLPFEVLKKLHDAEVISNG